MKSIITLVWIMLATTAIKAQLKVSSGTTLKTTGGATIVLNDMDLDNDGTINQSLGEGGFKFVGTQISAIKGNSLPGIGILEINKTGSAKLVLNRNININSAINFISGQLDLNNNNILLATTAYIAGESENNRVIGENGGFIEITQNMNAPFSLNAGNLGATITSSSNLGNVTIRRGHLSQNGTGLTGSIQRYYHIIPENNNDLNATLRLKYFDAELNGQNENVLIIYQSDDNGSNWNNMSQTGRNANANYVEISGLENLSLQTLANDLPGENGVTGLVFSGQRKKPTEVKLNWTTQTEINVSGFQVQRRLENEADFSDRAFVNSQAPGGTSYSQLSYQHTDANSYTDISYYRLKIVNLDNTFTYSNEIAVAAKTTGGNGNGGGGNGGGNGGGGNGNGGGNNRSAGNETGFEKIEQQAKITVGPNPNNGNFWFIVSDIDKETTAMLYTVDGKIVKQFKVIDQQKQQVNGLMNGLYMLKVSGMEAYKIIVQAGGTTPTTNPANNYSKF